MELKTLNYKGFLKNLGDKFEAGKIPLMERMLDYWLGWVYTKICPELSKTGLLHYSLVVLHLR
jgi:hypothetical protein